MNKATARAAEAAKKAIARATVPTGPEFERSVAELMGQSVNAAELKKEVDAALAARSAELSGKLMSTFRVALGL